MTTVTDETEATGVLELESLRREVAARDPGVRALRKQVAEMQRKTSAKSRGSCGERVAFRQRAL